MLNKQSMLQMASRFLGNDKVQALSQAFDFANQITDMTNDPAEALRKAGVTVDDLEKAKKLLNSPMAGLFLGNRKESVLAGINKAQSFLGGTIDLPVEQPPTSELEQMQANLARLK